MPRSCFAHGCKTGYRKNRRETKAKNAKIPGLFKAPKDPAFFEIWKKIIPRKDRELHPNDYLCALHFRPEDIDIYFETLLPDGTIHRLSRCRPTLKPGAIPCFFPTAPEWYNSFILKELIETEKKSGNAKRITLPPPFSSSKDLCQPSQPVKKKVSSSGNKTKQKKKSTNQMGKENILFEGIVLHPISEKLSPNEPVSFEENNESENEANATLSDIQNHFVDINELPHNESSASVDNNYVLFAENNMETEAEVPPSPLEDSSISEPCFFESAEVISDAVPTCLIEEQFSFNILRTHVNMVDTINKWWKVNVLDDFICFVRWTPDLTIERKVFITKDLAIKVFLEDRETTIGKDLDVTSIDVISKLIFRVERTIICPAVRKEDRDCAGFLQGVYLCKKHNLCLNCIKFEREQRKPPPPPSIVKLPSNLVELIRFDLRT